MNPDPLVTMVAGGIIAAFVLGFLAHKLSLPPIVGYLLAGIAIGPHGLGLAGSTELAGELAELGVVLIMFGAGLKFSAVRLGGFRWIAAPCALGQIALVTAGGFGIASFLEMAWIEGLIFGFSLSLAGAVVLLRAFEDRGEMATSSGQLAMSWLIVQTITAVLVLIAISGLMQPGVEEPTVDGANFSKAAPKAAGLGVFVLFMLVIGRRVLPGLLVVIARAKSREIFSLGVAAIGLGIAYAVYTLFGVVFALAAFLAGLIFSESGLGHRAADDLLPFRNAFAVLFFVSLGLLFDPQILVTQLWTALAILGLIILGNGGAAFLLTTILRVPLEERILVASGLAQIGEFSYLIYAAAFSLDLISGTSHALLIAATLTAILLNPIIRLIARLALRLRDIGAQVGVAKAAKSA